MKLAPKNWQSFQHYKDRDPTWIKLHKKLLDDFDFQGLSLASRALAPMLWLLASEQKDGVFDADPAKLAFRLRTTREEVEGALSPLIGKGFFVVVQFDSAPLAEPERPAMPETYKAEAETEKKNNLSRNSASVITTPGPPLAPSAPSVSPSIDDPRVQALHGKCLGNRINARPLHAQQWVADGVTEEILDAAIARGKSRKNGQPFGVDWLQLMIADVRAAGVGYDAAAVIAETIAAVNAKEAAARVSH